MISLNKKCFNGQKKKAEPKSNKNAEPNLPELSQKKLESVTTKINLKKKTKISSTYKTYLSPKSNSLARKQLSKHSMNQTENKSFKIASLQAQWALTFKNFKAMVKLNQDK